MSIPIPDDAKGVLGLHGLTPRQTSIVHLYCTDGGRVHKQVAEVLHISAQTVKNHTAEILRRCGATHMPNVCYQYGEFRQVHHPIGAMRAEDV